MEQPTKGGAMVNNVLDKSSHSNTDYATMNSASIPIEFASQDIYVIPNNFTDNADESKLPLGLASVPFQLIIQNIMTVCQH